MERYSTLTPTEKDYFMGEALKEASKAGAKGEVPIGAVVVHQGVIIGRGHNLRESSQDATSHAELLAIQSACGSLARWRLSECQLFVTLEPCPMCSGAIILARLGEVYFGAMDEKAGTAGSLMNLLTDTRFNHQPYVESGVLAEVSQDLLKSFFKDLRQRNKARKKKLDQPMNLD